MRIQQQILKQEEVVSNEKKISELLVDNKDKFQVNKSSNTEIMQSNSSLERRKYISSKEKLSKIYYNISAIYKLQKHYAEAIKYLRLCYEEEKEIYEEHYIY